MNWSNDKTAKVHHMELTMILYSQIIPTIKSLFIFFLNFDLFLKFKQIKSGR